MSFKIRQPDELVRIAAAGGGFRLDVGTRPTEDLVRVAAAASGSGARLLFAGVSSLSTDDLVQIASAGKGTVAFED